MKKVIALFVCAMISLGVLAQDKMPDQTGVSTMQTVMTTAAPVPQPTEDVVVGTVPESSAIAEEDEGELTEAEKTWVKSVTEFFVASWKNAMERGTESLPLPADVSEVAPTPDVGTTETPPIETN